MKDDKKQKKQQDEKQESLEKEKKDLEEQLKHLEEQLKRALADYQNLERRVEEERKQTILFANKELITHLLPAFDTLFLAAKYTTDEGVRLTVQNLLNVLSEFGIEKIPTDNVQFNPELMECIEVVESDSDLVQEEVRPGFTLHGKLIRPAQVKVGKRVSKE